MKRPYQDSNKRQWGAHLVIHYNTTFTVDKLEQEEIVGEIREGQGVGGQGGPRKSALATAAERGENCLGSATVRLSLLALGEENDNRALKGKGKRSRRAVLDVLKNMEGVGELPTLIGNYLYVQKHGHEPPAGDARRSASLPSPYRDLLWYHKVAAVAPGQSKLQYRETKKHHQEAVLVRADPDFYDRPWLSNVEIKGQDDKSWFAKILLIFSILEKGPGSQAGEEHHLAYVKYYVEGRKDNSTNSTTLTWEKKRMHGGGEGYSYDVIDVDSILGPVFVVPKFGDWRTGATSDGFYLCPWQR